MKPPRDEKAALVDYLRELHLPTMRSCFEELARQAEQETLSYERYLLTLSHEPIVGRLLVREPRRPAERTGASERFATPGFVVDAEGFAVLTGRTADTSDLQRRQRDLVADLGHDILGTEPQGRVIQLHVSIDRHHLAVCTVDEPAEVALEISVHVGKRGERREQSLVRIISATREERVLYAALVGTEALPTEGKSLAGSEASECACSHGSASCPIHGPGSPGTSDHPQAVQRYSQSHRRSDRACLP